MSLLFSGGMYFFQWEANAIKLWIPENSDFARNYAFLWENYAPDMRFHSILFTTPNEQENILEPKYIQTMYETYKKIQGVHTAENMTWEDACFRLPIVRASMDDFVQQKSRRRKRRDISIDTPMDIDKEFEDLSNFDNFGEDEDFIKDYDPSATDQYPDPYCGIVENMETACFMWSVLELWAHEGRFTQQSEDEIYSLTLDAVIDKVNAHNTSGIFLIDRDFHSTLGGTKKYDDRGRLVHATGAMMQLIGKMNGTLALMEPPRIVDAIGELVDSKTLAMEENLIHVLLEQKAQLQAANDLDLYVNVARSFSDIATGSIHSDIAMIILGFMIVGVYVSVMIGKLDKVKNRMMLASIGLLSCGLAIGSSYGLCSLCGLSFSPMHNFIPFLILGLGIDDMFVIIQAWNNMMAKEAEESGKAAEALKPIIKDTNCNNRTSRTNSGRRSESSPAEKAAERLEDRFGKCLQHAGVAITVTSLTDFIAFLVGASTVLPALRSFCIFCGVGILLVYFLQATFFVAWMVIDQKRIEDNRNGQIPCIKYADGENTAFCKSGGSAGSGGSSKSFDQMEMLQRGFSAYGKLLMKTPTKLGVIVVTLLILSVSVWGNVLLKQKFDPMWFLPLDSYLISWHKANEQYFPSNGEKIFVFVTDLKYPDELSKLDQTIRTLEERTDIITEVDSWYTVFKRYHRQHFQEADNATVVDLSADLFNDRLTRFLFSPSGARYRMLFRFDGSLECGTPAPTVQMFTMEFVHRLFEGPSQQVPAMNAVKDVIRAANFSGGSGRVFPFSKGYAAWETDEIISEELYRNLALAFVCIFATTLLLLSDFIACVEVLLCVVLSMVNVAGFMHFWGLTIETISCTNLIICIGLCVDSAAHITHEFLASPGSRNYRARAALKNIGPAVLNGGFSTFLAFVLCARSNSHVFSTFFKIFFLVIVFAMYNGLVVLPVLLSFIGPKHRPISSIDVISSSTSDVTNGDAAEAAEEMKKTEEEEIMLKSHPDTTGNGTECNNKAATTAAGDPASSGV